MRPLAINGLLAAAALACLASVVHGETFLLRSGGRLEGEHLNAQRAPADPYHVRTPLGLRMALSPSQVLRVVIKTDVQKQYDELLPTIANTAEGHWQMAEWCKEAGLLDERRRHVAEVIALDPDHAEARAALGHLRVGTGWMTQEEFFTSQGYIRSGGAWKLPQHVELEAAGRARELGEKKLRADIRNWIDQIAKRRNAEEAQRKLNAIRDPLAAPALSELLGDDEQPRDVKLLCLDLLSRLPPGLANARLIALAIDEKDDAIREKCLDELKRSNLPAITDVFVKFLTHKDNKKVNRAAYCLEQMGDPEATLPLIGALVTTHEYLITPAGGGQGSLNFSSTGGLNVGGKPKRVKKDLPNSAVLGALVKLNPGANFEYDEDAWRKWYTEAFTTTKVDLRRDP
jgi:hypothetical protein